MSSFWPLGTKWAQSTKSWKMRTSGLAQLEMNPHPVLFQGWCHPGRELTLEWCRWMLNGWTKKWRRTEKGNKGQAKMLQRNRKNRGHRRKERKHKEVHCLMSSLPHWMRGRAWGYLSRRRVPSTGLGPVQKSVYVTLHFWHGASHRCQLCALREQGPITWGHQADSSRRNQPSELPVFFFNLTWVQGEVVPEESQDRAQGDLNWWKMRGEGNSRKQTVREGSPRFCVWALPKSL